MSILQRGSRGEEVRKIQERLKELGYDPNGIDGDFGPGTERAVRAWESDFHATGTLDESEIAALLNGPRKSEDGIPHGQDELERLYGPAEKIDEDPMAWWKIWGAPARIGDAFKHVNSRGIIWVNRDIVESVEAIFSEIEADGLAEKVESFDGCFCPRRVRGYNDKWSTHTFAVAIDLNAANNGLGVEPTIDPGIVRIFKSHGWIWGGDWKRLDGMHFQRVTGM